MPRKPTGNPNGRPRIPIDEKQFRGFCALQCTEEEIAGFFECSIDTINKWCKETYGETFTDVFKRFSQAGKISLRRYQFKMAEKNPGMAIFLGKNWLGQTDKQETTVLEVEDLSSLAEMLRDDAASNIPDLASSDDEESRPAGDQGE